MHASAASRHGPGFHGRRFSRVQEAARSMFSVSMFRSGITINLYLAGSLIGFATGTAISILLLVLTVRAAKLPGASAANILFVTCSLIWNLGGLAHSVALTCGAPEQGRAALIIGACHDTAAPSWPITVLSLSSRVAPDRWQKITCRLRRALRVITDSLTLLPLAHHAFITA